MLEFVGSLFGSGLLGSLVGGAFRLVPEFIKLLDKKDERAHELAMHAQQAELEKVRGSIRLDEIGAQRGLAVDASSMAALNAVIEQQTELATKAGGFFLKMSAAIRPLVTALLWSIYMAGMTTIVVLAIQNAVPVRDVVAIVLNPDFMALLAGVTNYWFLDRTLAKRGMS